MDFMEIYRSSDMMLWDRLGRTVAVSGGCQKEG